MSSGKNAAKILLEMRITNEILRGMVNDVDASDIAKEIMKIVYPVNEEGEG